MRWRDNCATVKALHHTSRVITFAMLALLLPSALALRPAPRVPRRDAVAAAAKMRVGFAVALGVLVYAVLLRVIRPTLWSSVLPPLLWATCGTSPS